MPEAAIDKDRHLFSPEGEIRSARKRKVSAPSFDAIFSEESDNPQLGSAVALSLDPRHDLAPLFLAEYVGHGAIKPVVAQLQMGISPQRGFSLQTPAETRKREP